MLDNTLCAWTEEKHGKLYRCTNKATEELEILGEVVPLCPTHSSIVKRMLKRKEEYEKLLEALREEQRKIIEKSHELESIITNRAGQEIFCPYCKTKFSHSGKLEFQICPKCGAKLVL